MPLQLTPVAQNQFPILNSLVELLPKFLAIQETQGEDAEMGVFLEKTLEKTILPALGQQANLEAFDSQIVLPLPHIFMSQNRNPFTNITEFFGLQNFLFQLRKQLLIRENKPVPEPVLTTHQERIISPGKKAYELMGNNMLNIKESHNSYGLIFE
ncbi:MAG: hypothetical protein NTW29_20890 [Bacteroidetes bacterium]|nr:hypothetical protein [Bacteroidota bacterium]